MVELLVAAASNPFTDMIQAPATQPTAEVVAWVHEMPWHVMLTRLGLAAIFGLLVALVHSLSQRKWVGPSLPLLTTLVLLSVLVAMTTIVIGDSVARAFGMVGALSIVRFRTVVEDTRDTAFVIFAVVTGMAMGSGHLVVALIGFPIVALTSIGIAKFGGGLSSALDRTLEVRVAVGQDPEAMLTETMAKLLKSWRLVSILSVRQGAAWDAVYSVRLKDEDSVLPLIKALYAVPGVQNVELKEV